MLRAKHTRHAYWLLPLALAGCSRHAATEVASNAAQQALKQDATTAKNTLDEVRQATMHNAHLQGGDAQGRPLWRVSARQITMAGAGLGKTGDRRATMQQAQAMLYQEGKPQSSFRAARMTLTYTPRGVVMELAGGVQASSSGARLGKGGPVQFQTPDVSIDVKARHVSALHGVTVQRDAIQLQAPRLEAETSLHQVDLSGGMKASSSRGTVTADSGVWDWRSGRARATGNVTASHAGTVVRGDALNADTKAEQGLLTGNVHAVAQQGKATCHDLRFDWAAGTVAARGNVKLLKDATVVTAPALDSDARLNRAVATGGVTLRRAGVVVRAPTVVALEKPAHIIASGGVVLTRAGLDVKAARAELTNMVSKDSFRLVATGGVTARNADGVVRADRVLWAGHQVKGDGGVELVRSGNVIKGGHLVSDDHFRQATLTGDVHGRLANGGTVSAGRVIYTSGLLQARDGVTGRNKGLDLTADSMDATVDGSRVLLLGNVTVTNQQGSSLRAPKARYDAKRHKVYASGGVWYRDQQRGVQQHGRTLVADLTLHQAVLTDVHGSGQVKLFGNKKVF